VTSARYGSPWLRYRDGTIYRGEQTLAQAPTSLSMPGRDGVEEKFKGEVPYTERSAMKVFVNAVIPESPGAVDVHISLRDLRPGQECPWLKPSPPSSLPWRMERSPSLRA
jgi:hypothetical protein